VRALRAWLEHAAIDEGRVFRAIDRHGNLKADPLSGEAIAAIFKRRSAAVGFNPDALGEHAIMKQTTESALRRTVYSSPVPFRQERK
jgi:hypothetical protein